MDIQWIQLLCQSSVQWRRFDELVSKNCIYFLIENLGNAEFRESYSVIWCSSLHNNDHQPAHITSISVAARVWSESRWKQISHVHWRWTWQHPIKLFCKKQLNYRYYRQLKGLARWLQYMPNSSHTTYLLNILAYYTSVV